MRRTASEILRNLEMRVARLENRSARKLNDYQKKEIMKDLGAVSIQGVDVIRNKKNKFHGLEYELLELNVKDMFLGMTTRYAILEKDGRDTELMGSYDRKSEADQAFRNFAG